MNRGSLLLFSMLIAVGVQSIAEETYSLDQRFGMDTNGTVHLQTDDATVEITGERRSDAHLVVDHRRSVSGIILRRRPAFTMNVEERNGDLFISDNKRGTSQIGILFGQKESYSVRLIVPLGTSLMIRGDDDRYEIADIGGGVNAVLDDGELVLDGVSGSRFEIELDDGSLRFDRGAGSLNLTMDDGEALLVDSRYTNVAVRIDDGTVRLGTALADDGEYRFQADDGDVEFLVVSGGGTLTVRQDGGSLITNGPFRLDEDTDDRKSLRLSGGTARVEISTDDGDVRLVAE